MSQFAATKNPPWVRAQTNLVQPPVPPGSSLLTAQQVNSAASLAAGAGNPLAVVAQNQQAQQVNPAVSASYTTGLAALTLTQSALQQGAMLQQQGLAIPASLAATTQVANVNSGMVVEIGRLPQPGVALPTSLTTSQVATVSYPAPRLLAQATQYQQPQPHPHQTAAAVVQQAAQQVAQQQAAVAAAAVAQQQQQQQQQQQHSVQQAAVQPQYKQRVITGIVTKLHDNFGFVDEDIFFQTSSVKGTMPKTGERVLVEATYNPSMPFKWTATRIQVLPNQVVQVNVQPTNNTRPQLLQQQQRTQPLGLPPQGVNPLSLAANQPAFSTVGQLMESLGQQQQRLNIQQNNQHNWIQEVDYGEVIDGKMSRMNQLGRRQHSPPRRERDLRRERYRDRYSPPPPRKRSRSPPPRRPSRSPPPRRRPRIIPRYTVQIPKISLDLKIGNVMELRKRYSNLYIPSDFCGVNFLWQEAFPPHRPFSMDHPCTFHIIGKDAEPVFENDAVLDAPDADYSYSAKVMLMSSPALGEIFHKSCSLAEDGEDSRENHVHPARLLQFLVGLRGKNETVALGGPWSPSLDGPDPDKDPSTLVRTAIRTCRALTGIDLGKCIQWYRFAEIYYRRGESWSSKGRVETVVLFVPDVWSCLPTRIEWDDMSRKKANWKLDAADVQAQVNDIKRELESKNLGAKGLKSQLILRLTQALQSEAEKEMADKSSGPEPDDADEENVDENKKKEKEEEKKTREEKEKTSDKRNLPENPAIIVQPSKTAKNRKFDCAIMSLSLLLDYRQEDNKEHSFEVSLFAELFNEMMMRDFGFRIYRALVEAPEVKDDDKDKRKSDKKDDKRDRKDLKDMDYRKDDADSDKDDDDSDDDDGDADEKRDKDRKKRRKKKSQMLTHDPYLLLSFVYYDQTHCGYLLDKDLEEIFYMLGLMLTRAQVRKLIQKVCKREVLRYRRLTDGPSDSEKTGKSDSGKINLESLASGNKKYIPELRRSNSKGAEESSLVSCRGSLVDVGKLVDRLELSEKGRLDAEDKIRAQLSELERLQEEVSAKERQQQKLAADLEDRRQRLRAAEDELKRARQEAERCQRALGAIRDGLQTTLGVAEGALGKRARPPRGGEAEAPRVKREAEEAKSEPNGDGGAKSDGNGDGGVKSEGNGDGGVKSDGNGGGGMKSDGNGEDQAKRARKDSPPREKEEEATANGEK